MAVKVDYVSDEPIIIVTAEEPLDNVQDPILATEAVEKFAATVNEPIYRITDYRQVRLTYSDIVMGLAGDKAFCDPDIRNVIVGTDDMVQLVADSAHAADYGSLDIKVFCCVEKALAAIRQERSQS